jgi:hypothetical protein
MSLLPRRQSRFCLLGLVWEGDLWWEVGGNAAEQTAFLLVSGRLWCKVGNSSGKERQEDRAEVEREWSGQAWFCPLCAYITWAVRRGL